MFCANAIFCTVFRVRHLCCDFFFSQKCAKIFYKKQCVKLARLCAYSRFMLHVRECGGKTKSLIHSECLSSFLPTLKGDESNQSSHVLLCTMRQNSCLSTFVVEVYYERQQQTVNCKYVVRKVQNFPANL